jgi:magnesium-transporting ATPase (P-type)
MIRLLTTMSFFSLLIFFHFNTCYAQATSVTIQNPLNATSFEALVDNLLSFLTVLALVLVPIIIIIGAYTIMSAGGDPAKVAKGKDIIIYSLIALVIILLAKSLVAIIKQILRVK